MEVILKYLTIYFFGTFKFILGPGLGVTADLSIHLTAIASAMGLTTTAFLFSFFGDYFKFLLQRYFPRKKRKVFTPQKRRFVKIWSRYGVAGIAFLTPLLFSPILGAILANTFSADRKKIVVYMALSGLFWGYVLTMILKYFKHLVF